MCNYFTVFFYLFAQENNAGLSLRLLNVPVVNIK